MQNQGQKLTNIYYLVSTRNLLNIRYVGKTINTINNRLSSHLVGKCGAYLKNWINKERKEGFKIKIFLIEQTFDWSNREKFWISFYKSLGFNLCNLTDGGEGMSGYKTPDHIKLKWSIRMKEKNHMVKSGTPIKMINNFGNIIGTFKNIKEATSFTGHSFSAITKSIKNNKFVYRRFYKFELWDKDMFPDYVEYKFDENLIFRKLPYIKKPEGYIVKRQPHTEETKTKIRNSLLSKNLNKNNIHGPHF